MFVLVVIGNFTISVNLDKLASRLDEYSIRIYLFHKVNWIFEANADSIYSLRNDAPFLLDLDSDISKDLIERAFDLELLHRSIFFACE